MEARKLVGWNIRRLRVARGLTIEELADRADLAGPYLGALERGQKNVGIDALARLARSLGAKLEELTAVASPGTEPPQPLKAGRKRKR